MEPRNLEKTAGESHGLQFLRHVLASRGRDWKAISADDMARRDGRLWSLQGQNLPRSADPIEFLESDENIPRRRAIGRPEDASGVKLLAYARGATVAHLEAPLLQRRRAL